MSTPLLPRVAIIGAGILDVFAARPHVATEAGDRILKEVRATIALPVHLSLVAVPDPGHFRGERGRHAGGPGRARTVAAASTPAGRGGPPSAGSERNGEDGGKDEVLRHAAEV